MIDVQDHSLSSFIYQIYKRRLTGSLVLVDGDNKRVIIFEKGEPVHAASIKVGQRLEGRFFKGDKISSAELSSRIKEPSKSDIPIGKLLTRHKLITKDDLNKASGEKLEEAISNAIKERRGYFGFHPQAYLPDRKTRPNKTIPRLILDLIRKAPLQSYFSEHIPKEGEPICLSVPIPVAQSICRFREEERDVLEGLRDSTTLKDLNKSFFGKEDLVERVLTALNFFGLLKAEDEEHRLVNLKYYVQLLQYWWARILVFFTSRRVLARLGVIVVFLICLAPLWYGFFYPKRMVSFYSRFIDLKTLQDLNNDPILMAERFASSGRPEDAIFQYNRYLAINPNSDEAELGVSKLLVKLERTDEAISRLQSILKRNHRSLDAGLFLGQVYLSNGELRKAEQVYLDLFNSYPEDKKPVQILNILNRFDELRSRDTIQEEFLE